MSDAVTIQNAFARRAYPATVPASGSISGTVDIGGVTLTGLVTPGTLTSATLYFRVSDDGQTYAPLYNPFGSRVQVLLGSSRAYPLDPTDFLSWQYVALETPTNEAAARVIMLVGRGI